MNFWRIFYCTYPIENAFWMLISRIQQMQRLACVRLTNGPAGGQWVHAISNPQSTSRIGGRVPLCSTTQLQNLQNCLVARRQWTLFCAVNFLCKILCIIMPRRLSVTYTVTTQHNSVIRNFARWTEWRRYVYVYTKIFYNVGSSDGL